jgi:hypothetical protein
VDDVHAGAVTAPTAASTEEGARAIGGRDAAHGSILTGLPVGPSFPGPELSAGAAGAALAPFVAA